MSKVDVGFIVSDHFRTLRDFRTGKRAAGDYALFFLLPLVISSVVWFLGSVRMEVLNGLLAAFSIFGGFLLNLLAVVYTVGQAVLSRTGQTEALLVIRRQFLREVLANISFSIIACILAVVVCVVSIMMLGSVRVGINATYTSPIVTVLLSYLSCNFIFTLVMIVSRVYVLLTNEFDQPILKKAA